MSHFLIDTPPAQHFHHPSCIHCFIPGSKHLFHKSFSP